MKKWFLQFWGSHGDRIFFMTAALTLAFIFYVFMPDMKAEAKTILIGIAMLCYNKSRGNERKKDEKET